MTLIAAAILVFAGIGFAFVLYHLMFWRSDRRVEDMVNANLAEIMHYHREAAAYNAEAKKYLLAVKAYYETDYAADLAEAVQEASEAKLLN